MSLWIDDLEVLWQYDNLRYFVPSQHMTWQQQANSLVRFSFYLGIILYIYKKNPLMLTLPTIMMMIFQYYLYSQKKLQIVLSNLILKNTNIITENFQSPLLNNDSIDNIKSSISYGNFDNLSSKQANSDMRFGTGNIGNDPLGFNPDASTTKNINNKFVDSDTNLNYMNNNNDILVMSDNRNNNSVGLPSPEPEFKPKKILCKKSTLDNPFGNSMPFDNIDKQITPICPNEYDKDTNFNAKLFNNVNDLFNRNNSQRQFTTNPSSTKINNREAAIQFFYNTPYTE